MFKVCLGGDCRNICPPEETSARQLTMDDQTIILLPWTTSGSITLNSGWGFFRNQWGFQCCIVPSVQQQQRTLILNIPQRCQTTFPFQPHFGYTAVNGAHKMAAPQSMSILHTILTLMMHFGGKTQQLHDVNQKAVCHCTSITWTLMRYVVSKNCPRTHKWDPIIMKQFV